MMTSFTQAFRGIQRGQIWRWGQFSISMRKTWCQRQQKLATEFLQGLAQQGGDWVRVR